MNGKQIVILVCAVAVVVLTLRHDLPLEFPLIMIKAVMLFVKLSIVSAVTVFAYIFAGGKRKPS